MTDVEYFFDPACPWSWITSRWTLNVLERQPMEVDWRFTSLHMLNEGNDLPKREERKHARGLELLRVAAALRAKVGPQAVLPFYTAVGTRIHVEGDRGAFDDRTAVEEVLEDLGYPVDLAGAVRTDAYDDAIRADTDEAVARCGGEIGTPVISFAPPGGPSFFGPVFKKAPEGQEAVDLWNAVRTLATNPRFVSLKRSAGGGPDFD